MNNRKKVVENALRAADAVEDTDPSAADAVRTLSTWQLAVKPVLVISTEVRLAELIAERLNISDWRHVQDAESLTGVREQLVVVVKGFDPEWFAKEALPDLYVRNVPWIAIEPSHMMNRPNRS